MTSPQTRHPRALPPNELGGIDIHVNNTFDPSTVFSTTIDSSFEKPQRNIDIGPITYLRTLQGRHPHLKVDDEGPIINLGATGGFLHTAGNACYGIAKKAILARTRVVAREWGVDKTTVMAMSTTPSQHLSTC